MCLQLQTLQKDDLYDKRGYKSFKAYCKGRWHLSGRYAYNLIDAARVAENVCAIAHTPESQLRELVPLNQVIDGQRVFDADAQKVVCVNRG